MWVQGHMYHRAYVDIQKTAFKSLFSLQGIKTWYSGLCITCSYLLIQLSVLLLPADAALHVPLTC